MIKKLLATNLGNLVPPGGSGVMDPDFVADPLTSFERIVSIIIGVMTVGGGIYFLFVIITGAYNWISAAGDKQKLTKARDTVLQALIGLVVMLGAYVLVAVAGYVLGFSILNPAEILGDLWP